MGRPRRGPFTTRFENGIFGQRRVGETSVDHFRWLIRFAQEPVLPAVVASASPHVEYPRRLELAVVACSPSGRGPQQIPRFVNRIGRRSGKVVRVRVRAGVEMPGVTELDTAQKTLANLLSRIVAGQQILIPHALDRWTTAAANYLVALSSQHRGGLRRCRRSGCGQYFVPLVRWHQYCSEACQSSASTRRSRRKARAVSAGFPPGSPSARPS
jgi:hypothetical protein